MRDSHATPNDLQKALLGYEPTSLETSLIDWTAENWPMAARGMVYARKEAADTVSGVSGIRDPNAQLALEVAARVAIAQRVLMARGIGAVLPQWLEENYGLKPRAAE